VPSSGCFGRMMLIIGAFAVLFVELARRRWCRSRGLSVSDAVGQPTRR
jgi:hypothetical protein